MFEFGTINEPDRHLYSLALERLDNLTKPKGSLGILEEIAARLVAIYGLLSPKIEKKISFVFAGDHGVVEEGVSAYPKEVTAQMVLNFLNGGAAINVLARHVGSKVVVVDVGVDYDFGDLSNLVNQKVLRGTKNFTKGPAMTRGEAEKCLIAGYKVVKQAIKEGYNLVGIGDMGIGNTTSSSAITAVITGKPLEDVVGRGTGISDLMLKKKIKVIEEAIRINKPNPNDPLDVLSKVGGAEIGACAGAIIACAEERTPVVLDGFITTAGALIAYKINPLTVEYMIASHLSKEKGHCLQLEFLGLKPLFNLNLRLGEGTGAALGMFLLEAALKLYHEMATFLEAKVSQAIDGRS